MLFNLYFLERNISAGDSILNLMYLIHLMFVTNPLEYFFGKQKNITLELNTKL